MSVSVPPFPPSSELPPQVDLPSRRVLNDQVNRVIAARTTARQSDAVGRAIGAGENVNRVVEKAWRRIIKIIQHAERNFPLARQRAEAVMLTMQMEITASIDKDLTKEARVGYDTQYQIFVDTLPAIYWQVSTPATEAVSFGGSTDVGGSRLLYKPPTFDEAKTIATSTIVPDGFNWIERLEKKYGTQRNQLANEIALGLSQGKNPRQIAKRIQPIIRSTASRARAIARTEMGRVSNQMQMRAYDDLGDIIAGFQLLETLDERTRPHHQARHGTIYWKGDRQPNVKDMPQLPDEPNCRGFFSAIFIPRDAALTSFRPRVEFASIEGPIADPLTYANWFDNLADEANVFIRDPKTGRRRAMSAIDAKKRIVGPRRWKEVKAKLGDIQPSPRWVNFHDENGKLVRLKDLKRESLAELMARTAKIEAVINQRADEIAKALAIHATPEILRRLGLSDRGLKEQKRKS